MHFARHTLCYVAIALLPAAAQHEHQDHNAMNARGEKAMSFSQTSTTRQQAKKCSLGDFSAPELTHDRVPPGVQQMQRLKASITYQYEAIDRGGRLHISSKDPAAVAAIHDFLNFQIADHQTGDPTR